MELSDYITNCMSTERTRDFLEMQGEELVAFRPVLLRSAKYNNKDNPMNDALEAMAQEARNMGCKYVTNIQTLGYQPQTSRGPSGGFLWISPAGSYSEGIALSGTGLVPKEK